MEKFELLKLVNSCRCNVLNHDIQFVLLPGGDNGWLLQAKAIVDSELHGGGKYYISPHSTKDEVVKKCLLAAIQFVEHEVREGFTYKGLAIFNPHASLDSLCYTAPLTEYRKESIDKR